MGAGCSGNIDSHTNRQSSQRLIIVENLLADEFTARLVTDTVLKKKMYAKPFKMENQNDFSLSINKLSN